MDLELVSADEIKLPAGIADSGLSLAEIGAVTCIACLQRGAADDAQIFSTQEMNDAMRSLRDKGIFKAAMVDGNISLSIDLSVVGL